VGSNVDITTPSFQIRLTQSKGCCELRMKTSQE